MVIHVERELVLSGQPRPHPNGARPQRSPICGGFLPFTRTPFVENYQIWRGNTCGGVHLGVSHVSYPKRAKFQALQFGGSSADIAALCETRLDDERYTFFRKGLPSDFQRIHGVGLLSVPRC